MLDFLDKVEIIPENDYEYTMINQVEPYLEKRRRDDFFLSSDGKQLHYEAYEKLISRGSIVILHGFTESAEKFRETAYYFRKAGYSVFAPDLRGHGKSHHDSDNPLRVDIDSFDTYAEDLNIFINKIVSPLSKNKEIYIYSHSLGSTVALLYMMKYPVSVTKAVLSSPMICGNMGMPTAVAGTVAKALCTLGGKNIGAPGRCVFDRNQTWENSDATSKARFDYYHKKRVSEALYQTSGPSFSWVSASLRARDYILNDSNIKNLKGEMLIFKPQEDRQLLGEYTDRFARKANIKIKDVKNSRHEIFMSGDETLKWYMEEILEFFAE
jgi:lysophospholipase